LLGTLDNAQHPDHSSPCTRIFDYPPAVAWYTRNNQGLLLEYVGAHIHPDPVPTKYLQYTWACNIRTARRAG